MSCSWKSGTVKSTKHNQPFCITSHLRGRGCSCSGARAICAACKYTFFFILSINFIKHKGGGAFTSYSLSYLKKWILFCRESFHRGWSKTEQRTGPSNEQKSIFGNETLLKKCTLSVSVSKIRNLSVKLSFDVQKNGCYFKLLNHLEWCFCCSDSAMKCIHSHSSLCPFHLTKVLIKTGVGFVLRV